MKELQLAEKRRSLIHVSDVAPILESELAGVRCRLLKMPHRASPRIVGLKEPAAIEEVLREEVIAALTELTADDRERAPFRAGAN